MTFAYMGDGAVVSSPVFFYVFIAGRCLRVTCLHTLCLSAPHTDRGVNDDCIFDFSSN